MARRDRKPDLNRAYDTAKAEDLIAAWENGSHEMVYGDLIDELFDCATKETSIEAHSPAAKAAADYAIIQSVLLPLLMPAGVLT